MITVAKKAITRIIDNGKSGIFRIVAETVPLVRCFHESFPTCMRSTLLTIRINTGMKTLERIFRTGGGR
jgi:hypothetical protein